MKITVIRIICFPFVIYYKYLLQRSIYKLYEMKNINSHYMRNLDNKRIKEGRARFGKRH